MTTPSDAEPEIPDAVRAKWDELTGEAIPALRDAQAVEARATARVQALVIALLRAGVTRELLVRRPYSSSRLTQLQREHGLIGAPARRPRKPKPHKT